MISDRWWLRKILPVNIISGFFLSSRIRVSTFIPMLSLPCLSSYVCYKVCQGIQLFIHSMKLLCEVFYFISQTLISLGFLLIMFFLLLCLIHRYVSHLKKILNTHPSKYILLSECEYKGVSFQPKSSAVPRLSLRTTYGNCESLRSLRSPQQSCEME